MFYEFGALSSVNCYIYRRYTRNVGTHIPNPTAS